MGGDKVATNHISSMKGCTNKDVEAGMELKKGQSWMVKGDYDFSKHDGNLEGGKQSEVRVPHAFHLYCWANVFTRL